MARTVFRTTLLSVSAAATMVAVCAVPPTQANPKWGLNGRYLATSNGEWAKTRDAFKPEASLRSTWTISTQCSYPTECTGTVHSEFGWTATIYKTGGVWWVKHTVPDWQPCPNGARYPGFQVFRFVPTTPGGDLVDPNSSMLVGEDVTTGVSGACGTNLPVVISMPFKLVPAPNGEIQGS